MLPVGGVARHDFFHDFVVGWSEVKFGLVVVVGLFVMLFLIDCLID